MSKSKIFILILTVIFLSGCGTIKKGFSNQKKNNSDEFLVEKKSPLTMPPDFNELPIPKSENEEINDDENQIKTLISKNKNNEIEDNKNEGSKSFEESLLKKIKKDN